MNEIFITLYPFHTRSALECNFSIFSDPGQGSIPPNDCGDVRNLQIFVHDMKTRLL